MATFPAGAISFTSKSNGDTITPTFFNSPQDEIAAIETHLRSSLFSAVDSSALPTVTAFTPTWGNTGTANTTTNATIAGEYIRCGKLVFFSMRVIWGAATASGSGAWTLTLPTASATYGMYGNGEAIYVDSSAGQAYRGTIFPSSTTVAALYTNASPVVTVTATSPFTWATGDSLFVTGTYFAA